MTTLRHLLFQVDKAISSISASGLTHPPSGAEPPPQGETAHLRAIAVGPPGIVGPSSAMGAAELLTYVASGKASQRRDATTPDKTIVPVTEPVRSYSVLATSHTAARGSNSPLLFDLAPSSPREPSTFPAAPFASLQQPQQSVATMDPPSEEGHTSASEPHPQSGIGADVSAYVEDGVSQSSETISPTYAAGEAVRMEAKDSGIAAPRRFALLHSVAAQWKPSEG